MSKIVNTLTENVCKISTHNSLNYIFIHAAEVNSLLLVASEFGKSLPHHHCVQIPNQRLYQSKLNSICLQFTKVME